MRIFFHKTKSRNQMKLKNLEGLTRKKIRRAETRKRSYVLKIKKGYSVLVSFFSDMIESRENKLEDRGSIYLLLTDNPNQYTCT